LAGCLAAVGQDVEHALARGGRAKHVIMVGLGSLRLRKGPRAAGVAAGLPLRLAPPAGPPAHACVHGRACWKQWEAARLLSEAAGEQTSRGSSRRVQDRRPRACPMGLREQWSESVNAPGGANAPGGLTPLLPEEHSDSLHCNGMCHGPVRGGGALLDRGGGALLHLPDPWESSAACAACVACAACALRGYDGIAMGLRRGDVTRDAWRVVWRRCPSRPR
jgi:hypothetical protein